MDKNNKNEHSIVLRPYVDYRDPRQRDPYKPKPNLSGYEALASLGSLQAQQAASQDFSQLQQQGQFGQASQQSHFGLIGWPWGK